MRHGISLVVLLAGVALGGCRQTPPPQSAAADGRLDWRGPLSDRDRQRLRSWRVAWIEALGKARAGGAAARIAAEGSLLLPDAALPDGMPPEGMYRCRVIKLGAKQPGGPDYVAYQRFTCSVNGEALVKIDGSQRPSGYIHEGEDGRLFFVGAMSLGDERGQMAYGRDPDRDMVGLVERVGPRRWRLVLPYPRWESTLDVLELVPAASPSADTNAASRRPAR